MSLDSGCDPKQIDHDNSADKAHIRLKEELSKRRGAWVFIPHDREHEFQNDFKSIPLEDAPFYICGNIPEVQYEGIEPEEWDVGGAMASYSAGSEVAELRNFKRDQCASRRGPKRTNFEDFVGDSSENELPPPPPPGPRISRHLRLHGVPWEYYRNTLLEVREAAREIKRWGTGANSRAQWKKSPIAVRTVLDEGEMDATILDQEQANLASPDQKNMQAGDPAAKTKRTHLAHDLRRYTVNSHPALARALAKILKSGNRGEVMGFMEKTLPRVIRKFEKVTGRMVIGASIHWDSNLPHFNLWHTGLEKVIYRKGKGKDRIRFRRTATNLGSSGPGLRAWRRVELAFERLGKDFCPYTAVELRKEESRMKKAQGRMPGDWAINEVADKVLENLLVESGFKKEVEEGFREFVGNEEARYASGMAGRLALNDRGELTSEICRMRKTIDDQNVELEDRKNSLESAKELVKAAEVSTEAAKRAEKAAMELLKDREAHIDGLTNSVNEAADKMTQMETMAAEKTRVEIEKERVAHKARVKALQAEVGLANKLQAAVSKLLTCIYDSEKAMTILGSVPALMKCVDELAKLVGFDHGPKME